MNLFTHGICIWPDIASKEPNEQPEAQSQEKPWPYYSWSCGKTKPKGKLMTTWTQTFSGRAVDIFDPDPKQIIIEDVAHALSMICRFNGHCLRFYSVAEHSVLVAYRAMAHHQRQYADPVPRRFVLWALLHDAAEAYLKSSVELSAFKTHERNLRGVIEDKFVQSQPNPWAKDLITLADLEILALERDNAMAQAPRPWDLLPDPPTGIQLEFLTPPEAEQRFLSMYRKWEMI